MKPGPFIVFLFLISFSAKLFSQSSNWIWATGSTGPAEGSEGLDVSADSTGNAFVTGYFEATTVSIGTTTLTNADINGITPDAYIAKFDGNGNPLWARSAGGTGYDQAACVRTDPNGNAVICGTYQSASIAFGTFTLNNTDPSGMTIDVFIVKYDPGGNVLWARSEGGPGDEDLKSVCTDVNGNVIVTGNFNSVSMTIGANTLNRVGNEDFFIAKYDSSGNPLWARSAGGNSYDNGFAVTANNAGNIFAAGVYYSSSLTFGSSTINNAGNGNVFVVKYSAAGNPVWVRSAGGTLYDFVYAIQADNNGSLYIAGEYEGPVMNFGTASIANSNTSGNTTDGFLAKYDTSGTVMWLRSVGEATWSDGFYSLSDDANGNIYASGYFNNSSITFGLITLTPPPASCPVVCDPMFVVKYSSSGNALCATALASGGDDRNGVSVDPSGDVFVVSDYAATPFVVGADTLPVISGEQMFIAKYRSNCGLESVNEYTDASGIQMLPNPTDGKFTLKSNTSEGEIFIYNTLGEIVFQSELHSSTVSIDLSGQSSGIYFINVLNEQGVFTKKIIVR